MSEWKARRFWRATGVAPAGQGFEVRLDDRPVRTPAKAPLILPTRPLAEAVAAEWAAQDSVIDPGSMPLTRMANSAVDRVGANRAAVADELAGYGESDLICYRAETPRELVERQAEAWDPLVDWAARSLDAPLRVAQGVMFVAQPPASVAALRARVHALGPWRLTGLHDLVALSGSLVIGLAVLDGFRNRRDLWAVSRIDETWQAEQWGEDAEAATVAAARAADFERAAIFCELCAGG